MAHVFDHRCKGLLSGLLLISGSVFASRCCFISLSQHFTSCPRNPVVSSALAGQTRRHDLAFGGLVSPVQAGFFLSAAAAAALASAASTRSRRSTSQHTPVTCGALEHGEDLSVSGDAFVVLGVAHAFEQGDRKLQDVWVLEPVSASTVEVINNGAQTSYEALIGTTVGKILGKDTSVFPTELFCGHEVRWADKLEFRTGCAARTWMRDHARDVVRSFVPHGQVMTGFNTSTQHKRILNFVHVVKDSDNIKQDMSIDVYGRDKEEETDEKQIAEMYNI